jgi:hypothetical protein
VCLSLRFETRIAEECPLQRAFCEKGRYTDNAVKSVESKPTISMG